MLSPDNIEFKIRPLSPLSLLSSKTRKQETASKKPQAKKRKKTSKNTSKNVSEKHTRKNTQVKPQAKTRCREKFDLYHEKHTKQRIISSKNGKL